jgi:hypothetical protein
MNGTTIAITGFKSCELLSIGLILYQSDTKLMFHIVT